MKRPRFLFRAVSTAMAGALLTVGFVALSAAAPAGAATKAPIPIGYICSCTSPQASSVLVNRSAYEAYVDYTNAHGGIDGHKIKLYLADDSATRHIVSGRAHLCDPGPRRGDRLGGGKPPAWDTYVEGLHIPVVGADGSAEDFFTSPDFFFPGQTDDSLPPQWPSQQRRSAPRTSASSTAPSPLRARNCWPRSRRSARSTGSRWLRG
jgi:hypothetical protein